MGGQPSEVTQTSTYQMSPEQRELYQLAIPGVRAWMAGGPPQRYGGSTIAGFDPSQLAGQEMALGSAGAQGELASNAAKASNFLLGGNIWDPAANPNLQGAVDASVRPIQQNLLQSTLPSLRGEAVSAGGFGGSRQGIAEGLASQGASQAIGDTASKLVQGQYATNLDAQMKALGLLPQTQQAQLAPAQTTSAVGDVRQALAQALLGEQVGNFNYDQMAPFLQSKEILSLLAGIPGGTTSTTGSGPYTNPLMQALGLGTMGVTLGNALFGGGSAAAGTGGLAAILPFLSDRGFKENIREVGRWVNGLKLYAFTYLGSSLRQIGFMADEVEKVRPEAVEVRGGVKFVNFALAMR